MSYQALIKNIEWLIQKLRDYKTVATTLQGLRDVILEKQATDFQLVQKQIFVFQRFLALRSADLLAHKITEQVFQKELMDQSKNLYRAFTQKKSNVTSIPSQSLSQTPQTTQNSFFGNLANVFKAFSNPKENNIQAALQSLAGVFVQFLGGLLGRIFKIFGGEKMGNNGNNAAKSAPKPFRPILKPMNRQFGHASIGQSALNKGKQIIKPVTVPSVAKTLAFRKNQAEKPSFYFSQTQLDDNTIRYQLKNSNHQPVTFAEMFTLLKNNEEVRSLLIQQFKENPFPAYFWECPSLNANTINTKPFEFVLIQSNALAKSKPDPRPFAEHLKKGPDVGHFENLGKDATLVSPFPIDGAANTNQSLASFMRTAPLSQQHKFLEKVASITEKAVLTNKDRPTYLSTNGLGVSWLHARIEKTPKYFQHQPYKNGTTPPYRRLR